MHRRRVAALLALLALPAIVPDVRTPFFRVAGS
jgi:hypothetical protein